MTAADKIAEARGWPERLMIRDTGLHDDLGGPGQRIYTTAGRGYERVAYVRADLADAQAQEIARLRGLLWYAWHEFNAIRARDGAPRGSDTCCGRLGPTLVSEEWWNTLTEAFADAIGTDARTPWPSPEAKDVGETLKATP